MLIVKLLGAAVAVVFFALFFHTLETDAKGKQK